ncbi:MAG TPA: LytTR family DNA-binding domain-containing protein [Thermoanaerobaculia bacterium]
MRVRAAIVEDEPLARDLLRTLLAERGEIELVAEHASGVAALPALRRDPVDLLFLDVRMPEMDGFQLLASLDADLLPAVVFITAHDEYALRAFEVAAVDYLLKPIDERRFHAAVDRALDRLRSHGWRRDLGRLLEMVERIQPERHLERLPIRRGDRILLLPVADVCWLEASRNNVLVHTAERTHTIRDTLSQLDRALDPARFTRISRSAIVNVARIVEIQPWFHGDYVVILQNGARVQSTRSFRAGVERLIHRRP